MPIGRNVNEYIRLIDAYAHLQENGEVCPAGWQKREEGMTASFDGVADYLTNH